MRCEELASFLFLTLSLCLSLCNLGVLTITILLQRLQYSPRHPALLHQGHAGGASIQDSQGAGRGLDSILRSVGASCVTEAGGPACRSSALKQHPATTLAFLFSPSQTQASLLCPLAGACSSYPGRPGSSVSFLKLI